MITQSTVKYFSPAFSNVVWIGIYNKENVAEQIGMRESRIFFNQNQKIEQLDHLNKKSTENPFTYFI